MINTKKESLKFSFLKNHPSHIPFTDASNFETVPYLNAKHQNTLFDSSRTGISKENQNLFNNEQLFIEKQETGPQNLIVEAWTRNSEKNKNAPKRLKRMQKIVKISKNLEINDSNAPNTSNENCSICLGEINIESGFLPCQHRFCFSCIKDWSSYTNTCPLCKNEYEIIEKKIDFKLAEIINIIPKKFVLEDDETDQDYDETDDFCYICEKNDNNHLLLICDKCNFFICHTYCSNPPLECIPEEDWFCNYCLHQRRNFELFNSNSKTNEKELSNSKEWFQYSGVKTRSHFNEQEFIVNELDEKFAGEEDDFLFDEENLNFKVKNDKIFRTRSQSKKIKKTNSEIKQFKGNYSLRIRK